MQIEDNNNIDLFEIWESRVKGKFLYRGMSSLDLIFPLDPSRSLFQDQKNMILDFFNTVEKMVSNGNSIEVTETHFGNTCVHDINNIIKWTRRDLDTSGIDFTSKYQSGVEYSDCWQGSQLKQNIKTISDNILRSKNVYNLSSEDIIIIEKTSEWVNTPRHGHKPVVLWISRELDIFKESHKPQYVGSFDYFKNQFTTLNPEVYINKLPKEGNEFYCTLSKSLEKENVYRIEEL